MSCSIISTIRGAHTADRTPLVLHAGALSLFLTASSAVCLLLVAVHAAVSQPPPERQWKNAASADERLERTKKTATPFSCFCFNVLCDKYATRQAYAYCPSWALDWEYRKGQILKEITNQDSDILLLQEVEMQEFYSFFQIELRKLGYEGIYK